MYGFLRKVLNIFVATVGFVLSPLLYANDIELPNWFNANRVVLQTGLYNQIDRIDEMKVAESVKSLGAEVLVRHLKQDWRPPLWPSVVPTGQKKSKKNWLQEIQKHSKANNISLVGYYWLSAEGLSGNQKIDRKYNHFNSSRYGADYRWVAPDNWVCRNANGDPLIVENRRRGKYRGLYLDLASDYKEMVLERFKEMVTYGVEAFYFDSTHFPRAQDLCLGSTTNELYYEQISDVVDHHSYAVHQGKLLADTFAFWRAELEKEFPDRKIVFVISGTYLSGFTLPNMSFRMAGPRSVFKVEYKHGIRSAVYGNIFRKGAVKSPPNDIKLASAWTMLRDASNLPVHMWSEKLESLDELLSYLATSLGFGAIVSIHVDSADLFPGAESIFRSNVKEAIIFGKKVSSHISTLKPYREIELELNEDYKNSFKDYRASWGRYQGKIFEIYEYLVRSGVPVGFGIKGIQRSRKVTDTIAVIDVAKGSYENSINEIKATLRAFIREKNQIRADFSNVKTTKHPLHANYFKKDNSSEDIVVAIAPVRSDIGTRSFRGSEEYGGVRLHTRTRPRKATSLLDNEILEVKFNSESDMYEIAVPSFKYITLVSVSY